MASDRPRTPPDDGRTDPAITLRVYAHVVNQSSPDPAKAFAKAVAGLDHEDDPGPYA